MSVCVLQVSLAGLWLMPAIIGTLLKFWRFLFVWFCYSLITGYLMSLCSHKKMHHSTPRKVRQQRCCGFAKAWVYSWGRTAGSGVPWEQQQDASTLASGGAGLSLLAQRLVVGL